MVTKEETENNELKMKPMKCEMNYLNKSDGSAILAQGSTVALVSVNGPLDVKMSSQSIEKSTLEVTYSSKGGKPAIEDRYKENAIKQTCEAAILGSLYPRSGITVTIQEMEDYGGLLACCVNCVCLALLNSGLSMNYVFSAIQSCINKDGNIIVDPNQQELETSLARLTFVFDSKEKKLVTGFTEGTYSEDAYREALEKCKAASDVVFAFYRDIVKQYSTVL